MRKSVCSATIGAGVLAASLAISNAAMAARAGNQQTDVDWTGAYAGLNAGLSGTVFSQTYDDFGVPYSTDHATATGFSGGGQAGFNYEFPGSKFVLGVETDIQRSTLTGTYADYGADSLKFGTKVDWWGTLRARAGYSFGNVLPYVTGGLAYGHLTNSYDCPHNCILAYSEAWSSERAGWTAGAGIDYAVTHNLSFDMNYLYTDLGSWRSESPQDAVAFPGEFHGTVKTGFNTLRFGLNYKLGGN